MIITFDRSSVRREDGNGFLHVARSPITKEQVADYYGKEIPGYDALGLDPDKVYGVYRPAEELKKAVDTFNNLPIYSEHEPITVDNFDENKGLVIGSMGTDAEYDNGYIYNSLVFTSKEYIDKIKDGSQRELSAGYRYKPVLESGVFNGKPYQIRMTEIEGNQLVTTPEGRAGDDVIVLDSKTINKTVMKKSKKRTDAEKLLLGFAMDSKKPAVKELAKKWLSFALDSEESEKKEDELLSGLEEVQAEEKKEEEPIANDAEGGFIAALEKLIAEYKNNAGDGEPDAEEPKKKGEEPEKKPKFNITPAMDAKTVKTEIAEQFKAASVVEPIVGKIDAMAFDSAPDIYGYALDAAGIDKKGEPKEAYQGMVKVFLAQKPATGTDVAFDSGAVAEFDKAFPEHSTKRN